MLRRYYVADRSDDEPQEVDWLVGACLCVRASAAAEVGLFDERFFMYSEELDWCRRFRAAGWRVAYVPQAEVVHVEGASARLDLGSRARFFQTSKLQYAAKWHGPGVAAPAASVCGVRIPCPRRRGERETVARLARG